jgi:hypothetical protein
MNAGGEQMDRARERSDQRAFVESTVVGIALRGEFACASGAAPLAQTRSSPSSVGAWSQVYPRPRAGVHLHLLPNDPALACSDDTPVGGDPSIDLSQARVVAAVPAGGPPSTISVLAGSRL